MKPPKIFAAAIMAFVCSLCCAKTVTDTIKSSKGDLLIVSYGITQSERQFTIQFNSVRIIPGLSTKQKYNNLSNVKPVFFDRTGRHGNTKFDGLPSKAFIVPGNLNYSKSEDGFFDMRESPAIVFTMKSGNTSEISIPVFLAHYEKKHRYKIFGSCEDLKIRLNSGRASTRSNKAEEITVTSTSEIEADNEDIVTALSIVDSVKEQLSKADCISERLQNDVRQLQDLSHKIQDESTRQRINEALDEYYAKVRELEEKANASASEAKVKEELEAKKAQQAQQARADSIAAETQRQAEKSEKRTIWMVIGGAILAVVCFVGNQVFQHFRNISNQRSMQEMQDRMVKQAESDAKRRAQSYAHNKIHQAKNQARNTARDAITGIKTKSKGPKNGPKTI